MGGGGVGDILHQAKKQGIIKRKEKMKIHQTNDQEHLTVTCRKNTPSGGATNRIKLGNIGGPDIA